MYIKLKEGKLKKLIENAVSKAGSYRELAKLIKIPRSTLAGFCNGNTIYEERLKTILDFLKIKDYENSVSERLPNNWKQIEGGKKCVMSKKKNGTFNKEMKKWQKLQSKKLKKWHKYMKKNNPVEYYNLQYSRFKKIGGYKFETNKGEKVRNLLEKDAADILNKLKIKYQYEPLINVNGRYFFPDFLINNNIIIECTAWKGFEKAYKLKQKVELLSKKYKVYVVIPKNLYSYYGILHNHLILGLDDFVPVAQSFAKKGATGRAHDC